MAKNKKKKVSSPADPADRPHPLVTVQYGYVTVFCTLQNQPDTQTRTDDLTAEPATDTFFPVSTIRNYAVFTSTVPEPGHMLERYRQAEQNALFPTTPESATPPVWDENFDGTREEYERETEQYFVETLPSIPERISETWNRDRTVVFQYNADLLTGNEKTKEYRNITKMVDTFCIIVENEPSPNPPQLQPQLSPNGEINETEEEEIEAEEEQELATNVALALTKEGKIGDQKGYTRLLTRILHRNRHTNDSILELEQAAPDFTRLDITLPVPTSAPVALITIKTNKKHILRFLTTTPVRTAEEAEELVEDFYQQQKTVQENLHTHTKTVRQVLAKLQAKKVRKNLNKLDYREWNKQRTLAGRTRRLEKELDYLTHVYSPATVAAAQANLLPITTRDIVPQDATAAKGTMFLDTWLTNQTKYCGYGWCEKLYGHTDDHGQP